MNFDSLPAGWRMVRLSHVVETHVPQRDKPDPLTGPIPWVRIEDFNGQVITSSKSGQGVTPEQVSKMNLRVYKPGTVLCSCSCSMGATSIVGAPLVSNQTFIGLTPLQGLDSRYLYYLMYAMREELQARATGAIQQYLSRDDFRSLRVPLPPLEEQRRIADYLDAETACVDQLISLRKKQRDLLGERAKAYKRNRITGSARASIELRRIDWLGSIPAAWGAPLLNRISRFIMGTTFPHSYQGKRVGDYPFIKVGDFSTVDEVGRIGSAENWITREVAKELGARIVPAGAVLYARVGAALLLNRRRMTLRPSVVDDNVRAISFFEGDPRYWLNVLSLLDMSQLMNPGPVPSIGESQVSAVRVPFPPLSEQSQIADDLDQYHRSQRNVEDSLNAQMTLLAERRQALIAAAVTGQIDVSTASGRGIEG